MKKVTVLLLLSVCLFSLGAQERVLSGFIVKSGDIVDGVIPIYRELTDGVPSGAEVLGQAIGSVGEGDRRLERDGYYVSAVRLQKGNYFGHSVIAWMEVDFSPVTEITRRFGNDANTRPSGAPETIYINGGRFFAEGSPYLRSFSSQNLCGLEVFAGDVIDGVVPVYQDVNADGSLGGLSKGSAMGGSGGDRYEAVYPGWKIESIRYQKSNYFGNAAIGWMEVTWVSAEGQIALAAETIRIGADQYVSGRSRVESFETAPGEFFHRVEGRRGGSYMSSLTVQR